MNLRKTRARLARRRKAWGEVLGDREGFKAPGSNKKPHPEGRTARESRRRGKA